MRKIRFILPFMAIVFSSYLNTQAQTPRYCSADNMRNELIKKDPSILTREAELETFTQQYSTSTEKSRETIYVIPVVFHIIHDYGPENISDAQILGAIAQMNADYSLSNSDFSETLSEFTGIASNVGIEFRLAQKPLTDGCINGIERIPSLQTYMGTNISKLDPWQHGSFLNIWVVKDIFDPSTAAAFAYYPSAIGDGILSTIDGIFCRYDYVGNSGASIPFNEHTLSHEAGHWMNLKHPWGDSNEPEVECGDDQVSDTPLTEGFLSCDLDRRQCDPDILENAQNFMDYSYCSTMFTEGQKNRMLAALNSPTANRINLWQESNLEATGTNEGYIPETCIAQADFYSSNRFACVGDVITFHDVSWNATPTSRTWTFEGGEPATSTDITPTVTYSTTGWHKVELTANTDAGSNTKTEEKYIYISDGGSAMQNDTYFETFDNADEVNDNWLLFSKYYNIYDRSHWNWQEGNGYYKSGCVYLSSYGALANDVDALISPSFNLSGTTADYLFFKYASASYPPYPYTYDETLKIYYSTNCGKTWVYMNQLLGDELVSTNTGPSALFPTLPSQWKSAAITLPFSAKNANVRFKLEYTTSYYSNNLFIDDFNFSSGALDVPEHGELTSVTLMPNPASGAGTVTAGFSLDAASDVTIVITDLYGQKLSDIHTGLLTSGAHQYTIDASTMKLGAGYYLLTLRSNNGEVTKPLVLY